ncbi:hypothetical protein CRG98_006358 [Punica granatum]|uniref:Retrotransposon gag domain-containing protein n=1 Tax=Punica granatum TaxID=22663 RepID=A0A2I0KXZ0_PUNGR|nr:hypothetical protein CRG98_006358 [Punica granatum]
MPTRDIVVPNQFSTIQSRLAILLGLRDEEIRCELQHEWEHSIRTAWLVDFIHICAVRATGESYQRDACHGFFLLIFGTILFPYSSNLIDGALAQLMEGLTPARFLWATRWNPGNLMAIRIFLQRQIALHTGSCGQTQQLHLQTSFYEFGKFDACGARVSFRSSTSRSIPLTRSELSQQPQHMWLSSIHRDSHLFVGFARHRFRGHCSAFAPYGTRVALTRLRNVLTTGVASISNSCTSKDGRRTTTRHLRTRYSTDANTFPNTVNAGYTTSNTHGTIHCAFRSPYGTSLPTTQMASILVDSASFTALEGMVNQLATSMATNMTELMAMLKDQNLASSGFTPPPEYRPTVDPNPVVPPIYVTDNEDVSFSAMTHVLAIHLVNDSLPLPPAPTTVPLPPYFLIHGFNYACVAIASYASSSFDLHCPAANGPSALDWFMTLKVGDVPTLTYLSQKFLDQYRFCAETPHTLLDLSMTEMREGQTFQAYATEWRGKAAKHIPPITERQQAGIKLDMGVKLGRIEGPSRKKDGEASKRQTTGSSRKSKDATVGTVNSGHQASQPISMDYTHALQTSQAYAHPVHYTQLYPAQ